MRPPEKYLHLEHHWVKSYNGSSEVWVWQASGIHGESWWRPGYGDLCTPERAEHLDWSYLQPAIGQDDLVERILKVVETRVPLAIAIDRKQTLAAIRKALS